MRGGSWVFGRGMPFGRSTSMIGRSLAAVRPARRLGMAALCTARSLPAVGARTMMLISRSALRERGPQREQRKCGHQSAS